MSFCPNDSDELAAVPAESVETPRELPYHLSLLRVLLMMVLSFGLYFFYWFYLTWKQYRDHTGNKAYPVWHALTLLVPIYNLFRAYAHARTYLELMWGAGVPSSILPGFAVTTVIVTSFVPILALQWSISLIGSFLSIILVLHIQANLNRYWRSLPAVRVTSAPIKGDLIIGALAWLLILIAIFS